MEALRAIGTRNWHMKLKKEVCRFGVLLPTLSNAEAERDTFQDTDLACSCHSQNIVSNSQRWDSVSLNLSLPTQLQNSADGHSQRLAWHCPGYGLLGAAVEVSHCSKLISGKTGRE